MYILSGGNFNSYITLLYIRWGEFSFLYYPFYNISLSLFQYNNNITMKWLQSIIMVTRHYYHTMITIECCLVLAVRLTGIYTTVNICLYAVYMPHIALKMLHMYIYSAKQENALKRLKTLCRRVKHFSFTVQEYRQDETY